MKKLGIIGGLGAQASCNWYQTIIKMMQQKYNATQDNDYPEMYLFNLKLQGWSEKGVEDSALVSKQLVDAIDKMNSLKPDIIVMACNTIHTFFSVLQLHSDAPIMNMVGICNDAIEKAGLKKAGVLCSSTTTNLKLYGDHIYCDELQQEFIDHVVLSVQKGYTSSVDKHTLQQIARELIDKGADCIILGCTELPIAWNLIVDSERGNSFDLGVEVFDAGHILLDKLTDEINN